MSDTPGGSGSEDVIDQGVFLRFKEMMGEEYIIDLVNTFLVEVPGLLAKLSPALAKNDIDTFRRAAHSIKSNANTFGAIILSEKARELEFLAREKHLENTAKLVETLHLAYDQAAKALKELIA
jgi:histidine phosphotransfer protein HptB